MPNEYQITTQKTKSRGVLHLMLIIVLLTYGFHLIMMHK